MNFLQESGKLYEGNKRKWKLILKNKGIAFNEDIYNDSIVKTYDAILKREIDDGDYVGYWFRCFFNNSKRDTKYSYHNRDDEVDVIDFLKDKPYEEYTDNTDSIIRILGMVKNNFSFRSYHLFIIYYFVTDMTFEELKTLSGLTDVKGIIMRIKEWLIENV